MIKCWLFLTFNHFEIFFFNWVKENKLKLSAAANVYFIHGFSLTNLRSFCTLKLKRLYLYRMVICTWKLLNTSFPRDLNYQFETLDR